MPANSDSKLCCLSALYVKITTKRGARARVSGSREKPKSCSQIFSGETSTDAHSYTRDKRLPMSTQLKKKKKKKKRKKKETIKERTKTMEKKKTMEYKLKKKKKIKENGKKNKSFFWRANKVREFTREQAWCLVKRTMTNLPSLPLSLPTHPLTLRRRGKKKRKTEGPLATVIGQRCAIH